MPQHRADQQNAGTQYTAAKVSPGEVTSQNPASDIVADENTVVITSVDDLVQMSKSCVSESYSKGKTFVLTQDISLDDSDFQPIAVFAGNFQGNGHVISGLFGTVQVCGSRWCGKRPDRKGQCQTGRQ